MQTQIPEEQIQTNRPLWQTHVGPFWASIWENDRNIGEKTVKVRELSFAKRYKDKSGEFRNSTKYQVNDIPKAIVALEQAYEELVLRNGNREE